MIDIGDVCKLQRPVLHFDSDYVYHVHSVESRTYSYSAAV
jgi:hypothetical protein